MLISIPFTIWIPPSKSVHVLARVGADATGVTIFCGDSHTSPMGFCALAFASHFRSGTRPRHSMLPTAAAHDGFRIDVNYQSGHS